MINTTVARIQHVAKIYIMKLSTLKKALRTKTNISFTLPSGELVPRHFHVTEIGQINKRFIDCGGTLRNESVINFQLWEANDYDHRLAPQKLVNIIELAQDKLQLDDLDIEVEYQGETIQKFGLEVNGDTFTLTSTQTDCLAKDNCGIPTEKLNVSLSAIGTNNSETSCTPGSGCC